MNSMICARDQELISECAIKEAKLLLEKNGWVLLRGFTVDLEKFESLLQHFCRRLTFDPAREYSNESTQRVNAGSDAVGLHIENGNTPFPPDMVAFFSEKSARFGSATTICDGSMVYRGMSNDWRNKLSGLLKVTRYLPKQRWKTYVANELNHVGLIDEITPDQLWTIINAVPNQSAEILEDGGINYSLSIAPFVTGAFSNQKAFANALLGPSFNYDPPVYRFEDGQELSGDELKDLNKICEPYINEVQWEDGDVVLIDNKRVMHGRRKIEVPLEERVLHIGMGCL